MPEPKVGTYANDGEGVVWYHSEQGWTRIDSWGFAVGGYRRWVELVPDVVWRGDGVR